MKTLFFPRRSARCITMLAVLLNVASVWMASSAHAQANARPAQRTQTGTQHLLSPGGAWEPILQQIKPGDEVILMPGVHDPIDIRDLHGERDQPIIVRGLDPNDPPVIRHADIAISLIDCQWVHVQDIVIEDAHRNGVVIHATRQDDMTEPPRAHVRLHNLTISNTGIERDDDRSALRIDATAQVAITNCIIKGWAGVGVDVVSSRDVTFANCQFSGNSIAQQTSAMRIRGGSEAIRIERCTFRATGIDAAILVGGATNPQQFLPPLEAPSPSSNTKRFEARNITITRCRFIDQPCPIIFAHADRVTVSSNTFVRPERFVIAALQINDQPGIAPTRYVTFAQNLITWQAGRLSGLLLLDQHNREVGLVFEQNLWWSDDPPAVRQRMIPGIAQLQFPQILDVDPQLDQQMQPTIATAQQFGDKAR